MQLTVIRADDKLSHIALRGRLDHDGVKSVENEMVTIITSRAKPTVVDLSEVTFVASIGVRLLLSIAKSLNAQDCKMALLKPKPLVAETLRLARLDEIFVLAATEEEALAGVTA